MISVKRVIECSRVKFMNQHRKGAVVIIPLVCLVLSLAIVGELLKQTSIEIRQLEKSQNQLQAIWLADAAVQRAVRSLIKNPEYSGETWQVTPQEVNGNQSGEVIIEIVRSSEQNQDSILIRTKASYAIKTKGRVRVIREWPVKI